MLIKDYEYGIIKVDKIYNDTKIRIQCIKGLDLDLVLNLVLFSISIHVNQSRVIGCTHIFSAWT